MATAVADRRSFLDHWITRVVALIIAAATAFAIWWSWQGQGMRAAPVSAGLAPAAASNPALAACIEQRFAAIDDMLQNRIIAETQYQQMRDAAVTLCEQTTRPR